MPCMHGEYAPASSSFRDMGIYNGVNHFGTPCIIVGGSFELVGKNTIEGSGPPGIVLL